MAGELPATGNALGLRSRQEDWHVVAAFAVAAAQDVSSGGFLEDRLHAVVAHAYHVGGEAGPVEVHVDGDGGGGRVVGELALELHHLGEVETSAAVLLRQCGAEVAGPAQLFEVLVEEAVLAVIDGRPFVEALEHVVGEEGGGVNCCCGHRR